MNHFAGNFFKSAMKATTFSCLPKYSMSNVIKVNVNQPLNNINWINM